MNAWPSTVNPQLTATVHSAACCMVFGVLAISLNTGREDGNFSLIEPRRVRRCLRLTRTPDSRGLLVPSNTRNSSFWYRSWVILIRSLVDDTDMRLQGQDQ